MAKKHKDCCKTVKRNRYGYTEAEMRGMIKRATIKVGEVYDNNENDNGTEEKRDN